MGYGNDAGPQCSAIRTCFCGFECVKCLPGTYSKGGTLKEGRSPKRNHDITCKKCPQDRPYTLNDKARSSIDSCTNNKYGVDCSHEMNGIIEGLLPPEIYTRKSDFCEEDLTRKECEQQAEAAGAKFSYYNKYNYVPPGCTRDVNGDYTFNDQVYHRRECGFRESSAYLTPGQGNCICKTRKCGACPSGHGPIPHAIYGHECTICPVDTFSSGGKACERCPEGLNTNNKEGQSSCEGISKASAAKFDKIFEILDEQKEKTNDLSIKNSRLWQKEQIRLQHDKLLQDRKSKDDAIEKDFCKKEREDGTIIFPAIEISTEIEKIEDTTCIDTNRDELLKSFCSFTSDIDNLFQIQGIKKEAKSFWPNICCKERSDKTLEACKDPTGKIERRDIIPFALSQGGDYSRHNLYAEVVDSIKKNGYIHEGMLALIKSLESINTLQKDTVKKSIDAFFDEVSLCGPRIVDNPVNDEHKLCELFIPYHHSMKSFYNVLANLYINPIPAQQASSFLETMETSLRKRQLITNRVGKKNNMQQIMQAKPKISTTDLAKAQCVHSKGGSKWTKEELKHKKELFCTGYKHLDLSNKEIKNIAIHYLKHDLPSYDDKQMFTMANTLRYHIEDGSCPAAPLFTAKDISIEQVNMDTLGKEKDWVAVIQLNSKDENGYLQSELPNCQSSDYLIGAKVTVKVYADTDRCCDGLKDYKKCKSKVWCTKENLIKFQDKDHHHYSKDLSLEGTQYRIESLYGGKRRRRLFRSHGSGC
jgi:hypothetical protein